MALAKKCDRCGAFHNNYNETQNPGNGGYYYSVCSLVIKNVHYKVVEAQMKKYKVSLIFEEDYWPWTYIVEANNYQEALKRASRSGLTSDEDITRVEIVEV